MSALRQKIRERAKEAREAFGSIPGAFRLVWEADRRGTLHMAALTAVSAALPAAQAYVAKLIVDVVVQANQGHLAATAGLKLALPYLLMEFALLLVSTLVSQLRRLVEEILDHRLGHSINTRIIRKALGLELHYFENAEFYDKMQNARKQSEYRALAIINSGFLLVQNLATLLSFLFILVAFSPVIAFILFCATVPAFLVQSHFSRLNFRLQSRRAPETRRMQYLEHLLTVDSTVKEVKLFDLGGPLLRSYDEIFWKSFSEDARLAWRRSCISFLWGLLANFSYYASYAWIIFQTVGGRISLGDMTLYLALFRGSQGTFQGLFDNVARLYENGLFMEMLFSFLSLDAQQGSASGARAMASPLPDRGNGGRKIEFRDVSFRYPPKNPATGDERWALRHLNLIIEAGEKVALVGENGAGKTTLIKLLSRLYDPTEGVILLDGLDLREFDLVDLRRRIGVIFQDFVKYQLTVRENIGFGSVDDVSDLARVREAATRGGADRVVTELPEGFETTLGGWFLKGQELSGGQWQKVALSRAFMREGEVLVLDEPTSALDAGQEYEIFQRFRNLTEGKTAILISHRFSTVRMADRIVVLENGAIRELGSHQQLMEKGGTYARLFSLQAEGYR